MINFVVRNVKDQKHNIFKMQEYDNYSKFYKKAYIWIIYVLPQKFQTMTTMGSSFHGENP